jgi:hypothetical protein
MYEKLLAYIWKLQYLNKTSLKTTKGATLYINKPGTLNENAGPDFKNASVTIENVTWHGTIEIHTKSSNWYKHKHNTDQAYNSTILHVVWEHDTEVYRNDGTPLPTLEIKNLVPNPILETIDGILCKNQIQRTPEKIKAIALEQALLDRINSKSTIFGDILTKANYDWEKASYNMLAYNFGFKINSETFLKLSLITPLKIIQKERYDLTNIEALLMGQANLLKDANNNLNQDEYIADLKKRYNYLINKYNIQEGKISKTEWLFFRLRPANFPTIRIAQFSQLIHLNKHKSILELFLHTTIEELYKQFSIVQSPYWQSHYLPGKQTNKSIPGIGKSSIQNIMINTLVPILNTYARIKKAPQYIQKSIDILQSIPPENNKITRLWKKLAIIPKNAYESQGLIELFNNFCKKKKCMHCTIGLYLIKN